MDTSDHRGRSIELINSNWIPLHALSKKQNIRLFLLDQDVLSAQISLRDYHKAQKLAEDTRSDIQSLIPNTRTSSQEEQNQSALSTLIALEYTHSNTLHSIFHYAKSFICAMRRIGRVLEYLSRDSRIFPKPVTETIKLTWKKKRSMFYGYKDPRDAIEHVVDETVKAMSDKTHDEIGGIFLLYTMGNNDNFFVTNDKSSKISEKNLLSALEARNEIKESIINNLNKFNDDS